MAMERGESSDISIHAPAKGATGNKNWLGDEDKISIHAPAKGATLKESPGRTSSTNFNPRSREGSDLY